jgi:hypothetical protein
MDGALLEKPPVAKSVKNFFINVFTRAIHWSLSSARQIQSIPSHPLSL